MRKPLIALWLYLSALLISPQTIAAEQEIKIGVLSHRGYLATLSMWSPTADYLTQSIPGYTFTITPLGFDEVEPSVRDGKVDFLLVNPGIYVNIEVGYRISRIATLSNSLEGVAYNVFGGVIFTRNDNREIKTLEDIRGHRFMAVDETSLGGYQMAWRELKAVGVDPQADFSDLQFGSTHDRVVLSVLEGKVDAATVRTDILERMAASGVIDLNDIRIVNQQHTPTFPFRHSTQLYPEWPFSKVAHTSNELAQKVAVALLNMPKGHIATKSGNYSGWTIPLDYQPVHELFKELHLPPYQYLGKFTLLDAVKKYRYGLLLGLVSLLFMIFMTIRVMQLNAKLKKTNILLERQYELLLNSVADGIYGVDLKGNSTFVNRAMERITGWRASELIGANQHKILHHTRSDGSEHPPEECPVYKTFKDDTPRFVEEDIFWCKNGTSIPVEYSSTPIKDDTGNTVGSVVVFRDITIRKEAQEKARQHRRELAHVARLSTMGEMASGIAHEINQPLAAINTNARALIRMMESGQPMQESLIDIIERIAIQADRAGEIIRQLRNFVRKEEPERIPADLNDLIKGVAVLVQPEARKESVDLKLNLASNKVMVKVQKIQIEQVILNLARNAIEAMSESPMSVRNLTIHTTVNRNGWPEVRVEDNGPGLNETILDQLYDPFVTTKSQGMGLGLSISKGIIEAHDGSLDVETNTPEGVTFRFSLPPLEE